MVTTPESSGDRGPGHGDHVRDPIKGSRPAAKRVPGGTGAETDASGITYRALQCSDGHIVAGGSRAAATQTRPRTWRQAYCGDAGVPAHMSTRVLRQRRARRAHVDTRAAATQGTSRTCRHACCGNAGALAHMSTRVLRQRRRAPAHVDTRAAATQARPAHVDMRTSATQGQVADCLSRALGGGCLGAHPSGPPVRRQSRIGRRFAPSGNQVRSVIKVAGGAPWLCLGPCPTCPRRRGAGHGQRQATERRS